MISQPQPRAAAQVIAENFTGRLQNFNVFLFVVAALLILGATFWSRIQSAYGHIRDTRSEKAASVE
jgi:hypothetical protein